MGFIKTLLFTVGILLCFIGNNFNTYTTLYGCSLKLLFKHIGFSLSLLILYLINLTNYELGIRPKNHESVAIEDDSDEDIKLESKIHFESISNVEKSRIRSMSDNPLQQKSQSIGGDGVSILPPHPHRMSHFHSDASQIISTNRLSRLTRMISDTSQNNPKPLRISSVLYEESQSQSKGINMISPNSSVRSFQPNANKTKNDTKSIISDVEFFEGSINENIIKKIKKIKLLFFEMIFIFVLYFFIIITAILLKRDNAIIPSQDSHSGLWFNKCIKERHSITFNAIETVILVIILIKGNSLLVYNCIFKSSIYTTYAAWVALIFGPIFNVILKKKFFFSIFFFFNNKKIFYEQKNFFV